MPIPETIWECSRATEAARILNTAIWTANRFFSTYGFLVLPRPIKNNLRTVYLPDLKYAEIPDFWKRAAQCQPIPLIHTSSPLSRKLEKLVPDPNPNHYQKLYQEWTTIENKFWHIVLNLFPFLTSKHIQLIVKPTKYGTDISFSHSHLNETSLTLVIWCRTDQPVSQLADGIISAILMHDIREVKKYTWEESEAFIDLLFSYTALAELFPEHQRTLSGLRTQENAELAAESSRYLQHLGLPTEKVFHLDQQTIYMNNVPMSNLTSAEFSAMKLLITHANHVVSLDHLADIMWPNNPEKFSEWAITKLIQRLRRKLRLAGVTPEVIQTKRGVGYLLIN